MSDDLISLRPKLGLLLIGRKRPGFDTEWAKQIEAESLDTLNALGFGPVTKARAVDDASLHEALAQLRAAGVNTLVVGQPTIGDGRLAPTIGQIWNDPVVLWATPERPGADRVTACALVGQHLFASLLRQLNRPFEIVYGPTNDAKTKAALADAARLVHTACALKRAKVGLVGSHVPGFSNVSVEPARLTAALGAQLVQLGLHEFIELAKTMDESRVKTEVEKVRTLKLPAEDGIGETALALDARYSLAMEELLASHGLAALAVRCWPELPDIVGQWPYLAMARLASEHKAIALEGDADGALCSLISELIGAGPAFITDWLAHDEHTITAWHPGLAPFQLCPAIGAPGGPRLTRQFNNRKPLCVDAELRAGMDATLFRLWSCDGGYHLTAVEAKTERLKPSLAGNSALLRLDRSVPRWFDDLCHAGMPHHLSIAEGKQAERLRRLARLV
ncbi:MAG: sugar isomerase, partial [Verrucomicrobia bacterium]|nr:sugar isomerase [Verrucomicrobiota bacterium]